jgi:hypothetical protein
MQLAALPAPHTRVNWNEAINTRRLAHSSVKRVLPRRQNFNVPRHVSPFGLRGKHLPTDSRGCGEAGADAGNLRVSVWSSRCGCSLAARASNRAVVTKPPRPCLLRNWLCMRSRRRPAAASTCVPARAYKQIAQLPSRTAADVFPERRGAPIVVLLRQRGRPSWPAQD